MRKSTVREAQMRMLDILIEIDRICNENDIKYWLDSGTLLGAIRHKGFIPWDDDLDIGMLREDYKKFIEVIDRNLNENYYCQTPLSDKKCQNAFIKIRDKRSKIIDRNGEELGIFVDIFPYDFFNKKTYIYKKIYNSIIFIKWMSDLKFKKPFLTLIHKNIVIAICKVLSIFYKLISYESIIKQMYNNANKFKFIKTDKIIYGIEVPFKEKIRFDDIFPLKYHSFEEKSFPVPKNYEEILKIFFDDWNELPPKELRIPSHSDEIFIS